MWDQVTTENIAEMTDFVDYKREFMRLFGFEMENVDYQADVNPVVEIKGMEA